MKNHKLILFFLFLFIASMSYGQESKDTLINKTIYDEIREKYKESDSIVNEFYTTHRRETRELSFNDFKKLQAELKTADLKLLSNSTLCEQFIHEMKIATEFRYNQFLMQKLKMELLGDSIPDE
ncbi:MAG: hypothetical protein LUF90_10860 [Rikenellaceae bacterium]|nr:hypothetical protein [Rikenellaceae bacterium]